MTRADRVADEVVQLVRERAAALADALGVSLAKPRASRLANDVRTVVRYVETGADDVSNDRILRAINAVIEVLSSTCYPPATAMARAIFDRRAGEPESEIEAVLLAARARWGVELGIDVPIRWLAVLAGVSVKTARNLASGGQVSTRNGRDGQVATAREAARWLKTRGVGVDLGRRRVVATAS